MTDYFLWHTLYRWLPRALVEWAFFLITIVQLYWLGTKYLLVELHRKLSSSVRKLSAEEPDIPNDLTNYVALITGGSSGIGLSLATELFRRGCTVVISAFGLTQTEQHQIVNQIRQSANKSVSGGSVYIFDIDLRELASVCIFVQRFRTQFDHLDLLVNNAGVMYVDQGYTVDGFELHYQINYLSHALLTWLLLPSLNRAAKHKPARIVNVSSSTHFARDLFLSDLQSQKSPYSPLHSYAQSKLCVLMFTYYLADWLSDHQNQYNVIVNTLHPGVVNTKLYQHVWWVNRFPKVAQLLFRPPEEGAETVLYAALSTQVASSGHYYEDCRAIRSSRFSYRKSEQARLAEITAKQLLPTINTMNRSLTTADRISPMFTCGTPL